MSNDENILKNIAKNNSKKILETSSGNDKSLIEFEKTHTSSSIERRYFFRMGVSSLDANPLVLMAIDRSIIGYGVGHILYLASIRNNIVLKTTIKDLLD